MPVYTHLEGDYRSLGIGSRIRLRRREREVTLKQLAATLGVSIGTLSAIENDLHAPEVDLFLNIARALEAPFDALLPERNIKHVHIARRDSTEDSPPLPIKMVDRIRESLTPYHNRLWPLAQPFVGKHLEPFAMDIAAIAEDQIQFIAHHQEEFLFLLTGVAECLIRTPVGLQRERLNAGDSIYFRSFLPHCIRSISSAAARGIDVVFSSHEAADSELATGRDGLTMYLRDGSERNAIEQIGSRIAELRRANGMQHEDFAQKVGLPLRRLKAIEDGRAQISLALVLDICRIFRKPPDYFFSTKTVDPPFSHVLRSGQLRRLSVVRPTARERGGCLNGARLKPLANAFPHRGMQPYLVTLDKHHEATSRLTGHQGQEFIYVLSGALKLETGDRSLPSYDTLFPGDSCFVDATIPHRFIPAGFHPMERRTQLLAVFWDPQDAQREHNRT